MWELSHEVHLHAGNHGLEPEVVEWVQRERLFAAMVAVVAEEGYPAASVERVCSRAGVSRRSFYHLFADREECFAGAYVEVASQMTALVLNAFEQDGSLRQRIELALEALLNFCAAEPEAARACIVEVMTTPPRVRERRAEAIEQFTQIVERALLDELGEGRVGSFAAGTLVGGVHELLRARVESGDVQPSGRLAREIAASQLVPLRAA